MADARRKARRAADAPPPTEGPRPPVPGEGEESVQPAEPDARAEAAEPSAAPPSPEPVAPPAADEAAEPAHVVRDAAGQQPSAPPDDADFVFDDEPAEPRARRVLPSSGLAEDILRAEEAPGDEPSSEPGASTAAPGRAHQFTFFAAPEREAAEQPEATEHLVTFLIGSEEYGVDVRLVQEIIRVPAITPVPRAPAFAKGVINLRGRIIPVMDFRAKLGLGLSDATPRKARILVVRLQGRLIGLLVDGASQVLKVPVSSIEAAPEEVVEGDAGHIRGVAKLQDRLVILVDLARILAAELRAAGGAA